MAESQVTALNLQGIADILYARKTVDPADVGGIAADQDSTDVNVTVAGVALGDIVIASPGVDVVGLVYTCAVTAANTITVTVFNATGDHVNLASSTWNFLVFRPKGNWSAQAAD